MKAEQAEAKIYRLYDISHDLRLWYYGAMVTTTEMLEYYKKWTKRLEGYRIKILEQYAKEKAVEFADGCQNDISIVPSRPFISDLYDQFNESN